jgi:hypothetical protein
VWSDTTVNVRVLADSDNLLWLTSATYTDDLATRDQPHTNYWTWPPRV